MRKQFGRRGDEMEQLGLEEFEKRKVEKEELEEVEERKMEMEGMKKMNTEMEELEKRKREKVRMEERKMEMEEALNFIDSRLLLHHSDEEAEDEEDKERSGKCEVIRENNFIKDELEIGETEFLEQNPVSPELKHEDWPETTDFWEATVAFESGSKLKMEAETGVKMLGADIVGETPVINKHFYNGLQSGIFSGYSSGSKVEDDVPYSHYWASLKYPDGRFEVGKLNSSKMGVWKEELGERKEVKPEKLTLFLRTASESSSSSRTFKLVVKPGCSLGKVRSNLAGVLKVAAERIVLTMKGRRRCLHDSTLVQEIQDCIITACIL